MSIHGSNPLQRALAEHGDAVLAMLTFEGSDSLADIVAWIRERERAEERARNESLAAEEVS